MGADGGGVTSTPQSSLFEELPDDVLGHVFERLELDELMGLARLNKRIQKRVSHPPHKLMMGWSMSSLGCV